MLLHNHTPLLLVTSLLIPILLVPPASASIKVAVIGAGVGGTAAAHFLRQLQPSWHLELFERDRIGGRTQELYLDGKTLELGASIIHAQNQYVLSLAKAMNLTAVKGDDTGNAFSIYDGNSFVFKQTGSQVLDVLAVLKRYGVAPLRYKWLSEEMGRRFGRIYELQRAQHAYANPQQMWQALGLYNVTQQSAASYMEDHLGRGLFRYGSGRFIDELAGAINRINYNQRNQAMNALAGLVSYLPAAQPEVYSIQEGNAALPRMLAAASNLQAVHVGVAVQAVQREGDGRYTLLAVKTTLASKGSTGSTDSTGSADFEQEPTAFGPFDGVVLATPLENSGIELRDILPPGSALPQRSYQTTVTSYITGALNPKYFKVDSMPSGDTFVTNSASTSFSVLASKGTVSTHATILAEQAASTGPNSTCQEGLQHTATPQQPLWKVFSEEPLSEDLLQQLFVDGSVVISKTWKAYPRFHPPEEFSPFALASGLCYNNALENGASAMEVSAVAAMNCALLVQEALAGGPETPGTRDTHLASKGVGSVAAS